MKKVMAGEVLTKGLLNRINKAAYQHGGLNIEGDRTFKIENGQMKTTIPTAIISREHIKGNVELFIRDFNKTMNAAIYNIEVR